MEGITFLYPLCPYYIYFCPFSKYNIQFREKVFFFASKIHPSFSTIPSIRTLPITLYFFSEEERSLPKKTWYKERITFSSHQLSPLLILYFPRLSLSLTLLKYIYIYIYIYIFSSKIIYCFSTKTREPNHRPPYLTFHFHPSIHVNPHDASISILLFFLRIFSFDLLVAFSQSTMTSSWAYILIEHLNIPDHIPPTGWYGKWWECQVNISSTQDTKIRQKKYDTFF